MGAKRICVLLAVLAAAAFCVEAEEGAAVDYYHEIDAEGRPVFTQVLRWEADPFALRFEVLIRDGSGAELLRESTEERELRVTLPPGDYEFRVTAFNLLDQAETETPWVALRVIKAELPVLRDAVPRVVYMDAFNPRILFQGEKLLPNAQFFMRQRNGVSHAGRESDRSEDREVGVVFPEDAFGPGTYDLVVVNPGELESVLSGALSVKYQKPVDILLTAGYSPSVTLYDAWLLEHWPSPFTPLGTDAGLSIYFLKRSWGFLGAEAKAHYRLLEGGTGGAGISSSYALLGGGLVYKRLFTRRTHGLFRLGAGVSRSEHSFDYEGFPGPKQSSTDPYLGAGLAVHVYLAKRVFLEGAVEWTHILLRDHSYGSLVPALRVGYLVF